MPSIVIVLARSQEQGNMLSAVAASSGLDVSAVFVSNVAGSYTHAAVVSDYLQLSEKLERLRPPGAWQLSADGPLILCDAVDAAQLRIDSDVCSWSAMVAMLVVTHPEYCWKFWALSNVDPAESEGWRHNEFQTDMPAHFFPSDLLGISGLKRRVYAKSAINDAETNFSGASALGVAAALDEETDFAVVIAYALYRAGYRAMPVASWNWLTHLREEFGSEVACLVEDMNLDFADLPDSPISRGLAPGGMHSLEERDGALGGWIFPPAAAGQRRYVRLLVTAGSATDRQVSDRPKQIRDQPSGESEELVENKSYLEKLLGPRAIIVPKPIQSIGWMTSILASSNALPEHRGDSEDSSGETARSHSIPGRRALVAQRLVSRSETLLASSSKTIAERVIAAVLANEAMKVAGLRIPTVSMSALRQREIAEVEIESEFYGFEYHASLRRRFDQIRKTVLAIGVSYAATERKRSNASNYQSVIQSLHEVLDQHARYDERNECLDELRSYVFQGRVKRTVWPLRPFAWILYKYLAISMGSASRIVLFSLLWMSLFCMLSPMVLPGDPLTTALTAAESYLFGPEPFPPVDHLMEPAPVRIFKLICGGVGIFHLGLLVSYIFSSIVRR